MPYDRQYKAFNFDIDTAKLKEFYPSGNWRKGYRDIKKFMLDNGFSHRQWSGYISKAPLSDAAATFIVQGLTSKHPWIADCINNFDITNIGDTFSAVGAIKEQAEFDKTLFGKTAEKKQPETD